MGYANKNKRLNPLMTDQYQLTMSQVFFDKSIAERESTYYLHWRSPAFEKGTYSTVAGVEEAVDYLKNFKFTDKHIAYLASKERKGKKLYTPEFLEFLRDRPMQLDVEALAEGEIQTTPGPVMVIKGPLYQCQMVESALLNIINRNSIVATRASQLHEVIDSAPLADFGLRRASASDLGNPRAAYIGGCDAVADVDAGEQLGIPTTGTMAHALIMNFQEDGIPNVETELAAFKAYLTSMPHNAILLVDTYDAYQGIDNALRAAIETNTPLDGVRLDSGNLVDLAWYASKQFEAAKTEYPGLFEETKVYMTDGLDEEKILKIRKDLDAISQQEDARPFPKILAYGVGTELENPGPFRGGVYKVTAHGTPHGMETTMKVAGLNLEDPTLPSSKASIPGESLDVMRLWKDGKIAADIVIDKAKGTETLLASGKAINLRDNKTEVALPEYDKAETLLKPVFKRNAQGVSEYVLDEPAKKILYDGRQVTDLEKVRQFHLDRKAALPEAMCGIAHTEKPVILIDPEIQKHRIEIIAKTNAELAERPGRTLVGNWRINGGRDTTRQVA